jgi:hypothetical protein
MLCCVSAVAWGQEAAGDPEAFDDTQTQTVERGTSSKLVRAAAVEALPLNKMTPENRRRAEELVRSAGVFRRLPTVAFQVEPDVYAYFVNYPDVAVSIWRALDISKFHMWQTGRDAYEADAGDGSVGIIDVLYRGADQNVIYCEGMYKSPFLAKPIKAHALLHLQTTFSRQADGTPAVSHRADMFVSFPSQPVQTVAKILSPVTFVIVDRNFREISLFVHMMSVSMARQPGWVEQLAGKLEGTLEVRKTQLVELTAKVYVAARKRELAAEAPARPASLEAVMKPLRQATAGGGEGAVRDGQPMGRTGEEESGR